MHQPHCSTADQRVHWASEMIVYEGSYGVVSQMSSRHGISRQTLYTWKARGRAGMREALGPKEVAGEVEPLQERAILTLLVEAHASYRGIQACMQELLGEHVSLGE